jgi:isocitrate dehydrogenase kinase/phosphatase
MSVADEIARAIIDGFDKHYSLFRESGRLAQDRWERADWAAIREAGKNRIAWYDRRVEEACAVVKERFSGRTREDALWPQIKRAYIALLLEHKQPECAETFYNSVARRVLDRRYYGNAYLFSRPAISTEHLDGEHPTYRGYYPDTNDLRPTLRLAIRDLGMRLPFRDLERDLGYVMRAVDEHFPDGWERRSNFQVHDLRSLFFRNKAAYVVGRVVNGGITWPFVFPVLHDGDGFVRIDAILLDEKSIGRLFSLERAYFFIDMEVPSAFVQFLSTLVPLKPRAEIYTMVGLQKQGKTIFFRDLEHHLKHSTDRFVLAPGTKGMVMLVFTLPSLGTRPRSANRVRRI